MAESPLPPKRTRLQFGQPARQGSADSRSGEERAHSALPRVKPTVPGGLVAPAEGNTSGETAAPPSGGAAAAAPPSAAPVSADLPDGAQSSAAAAPGSARRRCPVCKSGFSGDAAFCPFDGERLELGHVAPAHDPLVGRVIDHRYKIEAVLGEGGMGTVYDVTHTSLDRHFAMKILRPDLSGERDLGSRFIREARAAAAVSHPNVVQITDFGKLSTGQPFFVMELLQGKSLSALMRTEAVDALRTLRILSQVARGLGAAHRAGVIHRDLKPENVVVVQSGAGDVVKVVDFGLARVAGQSRLTKGGMVFGTPHYMSPEQASGAEVDTRSDQYSLGVLMYEAFAGRVPFEADTYMGIMTQHVYAEPTPPSAYAVDSDRISPEAEAIILKCLAKNPRDRYRDMDALADALDELSGDRTSASAPAGPVGVGVEPSLGAVPGDERGALQVIEIPGVRRRGSSQRALLYLAVAVLAAIGVLLLRAVLHHGGPSADGAGPSPAPGVSAGGSSRGSTAESARDDSPSGVASAARLPVTATAAAHGGDRSVDSTRSGRAPHRPVPAPPPSPRAPEPLPQDDPTGQPPESPEAVAPGARPRPKAGSQNKDRTRFGGGEIVDPWPN